ncbi:MAG: GMC oxidoreductase [Candidatus Sumerlaeia bacterium]|nr:GMC oxidoreductase [Candidatus Sumerlaeia bacterium]
MREEHTIFSLSFTENRSTLQKTWGLSDFYSATADWPYPRGLVQPLNRMPPEILEAWPPGVAGGHESGFLATHSLEFWITSEDLPDPANRVALDPDGAIRVRYSRNNTVAHERLTAKLAEILATIEGPGYRAQDHFRAQVMPIGVNSHQCGTARFGEDPAASVLDLDCKAHDLDNLYVVDASFFPSSGAVNPSLTIIANALRVGAHLQERLS